MIMIVFSEFILFPPFDIRCISDSRLRVLSIKRLDVDVVRKIMRSDPSCAVCPGWEKEASDKEAVLAHGEVFLS